MKIIRTYQGESNELSKTEAAWLIERNLEDSSFRMRDFLISCLLEDEFAAKRALFGDRQIREWDGDYKTGKFICVDYDVKFN